MPPLYPRKGTIVNAEPIRAVDKLTLRKLVVCYHGIVASEWKHWPLPASFPASRNARVGAELHDAFQSTKSVHFAAARQLSQDAPNAPWADSS